MCAAVDRRGGRGGRRYLAHMQSPSNLEVTALARSLAAALYRSTSTFPDSERFGLTARMRRAAISIGSDISEGCGRNGPQDFARFLHMALGSASELEFQAAALSLPRSTAPAPYKKLRRP